MTISAAYIVFPPCWIRLVLYKTAHTGRSLRWDPGDFQDHSNFSYIFRRLPLTLTVDALLEAYSTVASQCERKCTSNGGMEPVLTCWRVLAIMLVFCSRHHHGYVLALLVSVFASNSFEIYKETMCSGNYEREVVYLDWVGVYFMLERSEKIYTDQGGD